ncbi:MAG: hypothetical protein HC897_06725 [Thermoanaerobaculia bacterium]|nr:hypothetical protein [Thermoanaerobaculia bacterium]
MPTQTDATSADGVSARFLARLIVFPAAALVIVTTLLAGRLLALPLALWALLPYALFYLASKRLADPWTVGGAGTFAIAAEIGIRSNVFLFSSSSTAGIALGLYPIYISVFFLPAGAVFGWLMGRLWRKGAFLSRSVVVVLATGVLALTVLALARPERLPAAVARREQIEQAIGEPRVVVDTPWTAPSVGLLASEKTIISGRRGWCVVGELDGSPGDEIALVDHAGADLFDPTNFLRKTRVPFVQPHGQLWQTTSTLARFGEELVVVQTGGGFSSTEVRGLDGRLLWQYRPDPERAPGALLPADLDGDGVVELYASWSEGIARLDDRGKEVWRRPMNQASLTAFGPRTGQEAAWVVAHERSRQNTVWDEHGRLLATVPLPDRYVIAVVEMAQGRGLLLSGPSIRVIGLDGTILFERPLESMSLDQGVSGRFQPGGGPVLALYAAAPRDVQRWRLLLLAADGGLLYDEILAKPLRLHKARRADGGETLVLDGEHLSAMQLRPAKD